MQSHDEIGVSVRRASQLIGIGVTKTYELLKDGALKSRKIGRRTVVSRKSIDAFINQPDLDGGAE